MTFPKDWTVVVDPTIRERGSCGKARYDSPGAAERSITTMKRHGRHQPYKGRLHVYRCDECRVWHVGHDGFIEGRK